MFRGHSLPPSHSLILVAMLGLTMLLGHACSRFSQPRLPLRWLYLHTKFAAPNGVDDAEAVMKRAAAVGCNGVILAEATLYRGTRAPDRDRANFTRIKRLAEQLNIEMIPAVFLPTSVTVRDPNLVEAMPVRNALFVVENGTARLEPDPPVMLANGSFEEGPSDAPSGWFVRTTGGVTIIADNAVSRNGRRSLRVTDATPDDKGTVSFWQSVVVAPWRQYHLSLWVKTQGFSAVTALQPWIVDDSGRPLNYSQWTLPSDADWTLLHAVFNSQANRRISVRLSVQQPRGTLWLDNVQLQEVGLVNLVRRPGCPLVVRGDDGTVYSEGQDYAPVADPLLGRSPVLGAYSSYHTPPDGIRLVPGSRIPSGARLRVSYYHCPVVYDRAVCQCLSEPATYDAMEQEVRRVQDLLAPARYMMSHDEMRVINWCEVCRKRNMTPGELLADNVRRSVGIIRKVNPQAKVAVWSDMFDPRHNARDQYYLVNGSLSGSWNGLPSDVLIVNWNSTAPAASLRWFAERGHRQVIAAYYDSPLERVRNWMEAAQGVQGVDGIMYTTWVRNYRDLEEFAKIAWR